MAAPLHLTSASCFPSKNGVVSPQASLSCSSKNLTGSKSQSTSLFSSSTPNLTVEFYQKFSKSLQIRSRKKRGDVSMMAIGTPMVVYSGAEDERYQWVDLWNAFYRDRIVFIGQEITEEFSNQLLATLLYLDTLDIHESILMYINSPGGDITPSLALYDTIQSLHTPVETNCLGFAGDMAGFILASGEKGKRCGMPQSRIELRSPAGSARGRTDDVLNEARELERIRDYVFHEFAKNTGHPVEKVYKDLFEVKRFGIAQAIEYGIIDRVVRTKMNKNKDDSSSKEVSEAPQKKKSGLGILR